MGWSSPLIICCRHGQHGERGTVSVCLVWTCRKYQKISSTGETSWSHHLELQTGLQQGDRVGGGEDEGGGEAVAGDDQHWDWGTPRQDCLHLNCSNTGQSGNRYDVFIALTSIYYQGSRLFWYKLNFPGRKKLDKFLKDRLSITVEKLRPPNRKNKKRTKDRAVERFEGEVEEIVNEILTSEYDHIFHSQQSREDYAKEKGRFHLIHCG